MVRFFLLAGILLLPGISLAFSSSTDLVSYYAFEESSGVRYDETAANNDLTAYNTPGVTTGVIGNAIDFDSSFAEYVSILDASSDGNLDGQTDMSWSFWVYFNTLPTSGQQHTLFVKDDNGAAGTRAYEFNFTNSSGVYKVDGCVFGTGYSWPTNAYCGNITQSFTLSTWYFVTITFTGGGASFPLRLYVDGSLVGTFTNTGGSGTSDVQDSTAAFSIGDSFLLPLDAYVDEFAVWDVVLTLADHQSLYNGGDGWAYPFVATSTATTTSTTTSTTADVTALTYIFGYVMSVLFFLMFAWFGYRITRYFVW